MVIDCIDIFILCVRLIQQLFLSTTKYSFQLLLKIFIRVVFKFAEAKIRGNYKILMYERAINTLVAAQRLSAVCYQRNSSKIPK